jgi:hypothetical protein
MAEVKVNVQDIVKSLTTWVPPISESEYLFWVKLRLIGVWQFRVRAKLGLAIMKFGAQVIGMGVEVEAMEVAPAAPGPPPPPPNDTVEKGM